MEMEMKPIYAREFEVLMIGESGVGKSSFLRRFQQRGIEKSRRATIVLEWATRVWEKDGKQIKMELWNAPGKLSYRSTMPNFFRRAHAFLFVYDITNKKSFLRLPYWFNAVSDYGRDEALSFLVGNKKDLESSRKVTTESVNVFARRYNLPTYETSSLTGEGVEETFSSVLKFLEEQPLLSESAEYQLLHPLPCAAPDRTHC